MRSPFYIFIFALVARPVISSIHFVYPPAFAPKANFSSNIVMVEGDFKVIQWADVSNSDNARISVTMFQLNGTNYFGGPEYLIQNAAPNNLFTTWTVNTGKNLTISPMFYLNLFLEGETASLTNSHYFNVTSKSIVTTPSSDTKASSTSISVSGSQTSIIASSATTISLPSPPMVATSTLSTSAKVGIAVGVVGAALLGLLAGWLILGRKKGNSNVKAQPPDYPSLEIRSLGSLKPAQQTQ